MTIVIKDDKWNQIIAAIDQHEKLRNQSEFVFNTYKSRYVDPNEALQAGMKDELDEIERKRVSTFGVVCMAVTNYVIDHKDITYADLEREFRVSDVGIHLVACKRMFNQVAKSGVEIINPRGRPCEYETMYILARLESYIRQQQNQFGYQDETTNLQHLATAGFRLSKEIPPQAQVHSQ